MLYVNDEFKCWLRYHLADKDYAQHLMRILSEVKDSTLLEVWPHAALPGPPRDSDPEVMIGMMRGHDNQKNKDFILAIFGAWREFAPLSLPYAHLLLGLGDSMTDEEISKLPDLYEIAFVSSDTDAPMLKVRLKYQEKSFGAVIAEETLDSFKINLVNTKYNSDLLKSLTEVNHSGHNQKRS